MAKTLYVLLTRTGTLPSRIIHAATGDGFTHVSIALDEDLREMYSFARKYTHLPFPAGLIQESLHAGVYGRNAGCQCRLYSVEVTGAQYHAARTRIAAMMAEQAAYHYSMLGLLLCKLNIAHTRQRHMFCSQFVASVLQGAGIAALPKPASLMRPVDFEGLEGLTCRYEGPLALCGGAPLYKVGTVQYTRPGGDGHAAAYSGGR